MFIATLGTLSLIIGAVLIAGGIGLAILWPHMVTTVMSAPDDTARLRQDDRLGDNPTRISLHAVAAMLVVYTVVLVAHAAFAPRT